ncbi:MAG: peptidoglycan DD-metalloendopeptidase family protein [Candidatus Latescibacteria bacterium]|nr:peptidoglycan DD-metalloendopeptidase family protein [Candidatus Latescibacterota bacterium]
MPRLFIIRCFMHALIMVSILFVPAEAKSESDNELQKRIETLKNEINKTEKELKKDEKKLKSIEQEKKKVLNDLNIYNKKIEAVNRNLWAIKKEERFLNTKISEASTQLDNTRQTIQSQSDDYSRILRSMYKRRNFTAIQILFTTGSVSSFLRGFKMFSALAATDIIILDNLRAHQDSLNTSVKKYEEARNAQLALALVKRGEEKELSNTKKKRQTLLSSLEHDMEAQGQIIQKRRKEMLESQTFLDNLLIKLNAEIKISDDLMKYDFLRRKGQLPWPVSGKVVSSFGVVVDEKTKTKTTNRGIEILTQHNEPVRSIYNGKVYYMNTIRGYGNFIMIYHPPGYWTIYGHLSDILVSIGDEVSEGDVIGSAGSTGLMDDKEAHLLLEVLKGKNPENPITWLKTDKQRVMK